MFNIECISDLVKCLKIENERECVIRKKRYQIVSMKKLDKDALVTISTLPCIQKLTFLQKILRSNQFLIRINVKEIDLNDLRRWSTKWGRNLEIKFLPPRIKSQVDGLEPKKTVWRSKSGRSKKPSNGWFWNQKVDRPRGGSPKPCLLLSLDCSLRTIIRNQS